MKEKSKISVHFRPLFFGFLALLFALTTTKFVFSGNITYIILDACVLLALTIFLILKRQYIFLCVIMSFFLIGCGWFFIGISSFSAEEYVGVSHISGRLTDYSSGSKCILDNVKINGKNAKNIYVSIVYDENLLKTGDFVEFDAEVKNKHLFSLGNLDTFTFRHNIAYSAQVNETDITVTGTKMTFAEKVRETVMRVLVSTLGEKNAGTAYAMLFGDKTQVGENVKDAYNGAGIYHLLTVSGLHISFLIALVSFILKKCRVRGFVNFLLCFIFIGFYSYLCSFSPSVVRAGIMGIVFVITRLYGRWYDNLSSLGIAGILILIVSPLSAFDVGFLMSFLSVLAIFLLYPSLSRLLEKVFPNKVAQLLSLSISANIGILPVIAKIFANFNFLFFFVNLIVVPLFAVVFPMLFVGTALAFVSLSFGFVNKICGYGLDAISFIANKFSKTSLTVQLSPTTIYVSIALLVFLFIISRFFIANRKSKMISCGVAFSILLALFGFSFIPVGVTSSVSFYNSFYTYSILITNSAKESVIIDLGTHSDTQNLLKACGVKSVEAVFVLGNTNINYEAFSNACGKNIICCEKEFGYDEEISVLRNTNSSLGGFSFSYHATASKLLGLEISFDQTKLFVFSKSDMTQEDVEMIASQNFDIVIFEGNSYYATTFSYKTIVLAGETGEGVVSNTNSDGNIRIDINQNNYSWRCLD